MRRITPAPTCRSVPHFHGARRRLSFLCIGLVTLSIAVGAVSDLRAGSNVFIESGIAASDREWTGPDYAQAAEILATGKVPLPQESDEIGRALVRRMTSLDNLKLFRDSTLPIESRFANYIPLINGANSIFKLYLASLNAGKSVHREVAEYMSFLLYVAAVDVDLMEEYIPKIAKDDRYAARMEGVKKMHSGLTTIFVGAEISLSERAIYSDEDLSILLRAMASTLPTMKAWFSDDYRHELRHKLQSDRSKFTRQEDIQNIDKMLEALAS